MIISFNPIVFALGPLAVRWSGLLALLGLGLAIGLSLRALDRAQSDGAKLGRQRALDALAWALPAGLLCARLLHVLEYWDFYLTRAGELWQLNLDGLSLWGGLLGGLAIGAARLKRDPLKRRRILDTIVPYVALGIAVGRVGMFLDGHGQGLPSNLRWATMYSNPLAASPDFSVARHPAQLYDALIVLALGGLVLGVPRRAPAGSRFAVFLVGYGVARLALGAVRLDPTFLFGLQIEQLLALVAVACGVVFGMRPLLGGVGRLSVRLFTRPGCHLCEQAQADLAALQRRVPHTVEIVDISGDPVLEQRYGERVPVVTVGEREYAAPLNRATLERAL